MTLKDLLQNEKFCSRSFCVQRHQNCGKVWRLQNTKGITKLALPVRQRLKCGIFCFPRTKPPEFRKDGFSAVRFHASSTAFLG